MELIDHSGTRQACDRCHRVRVRFAGKADALCRACRRAVAAPEMLPTSAEVRCFDCGGIYAVSLAELRVQAASSSPCFMCRGCRAQVRTAVY